MSQALSTTVFDLIRPDSTCFVLESLGSTRFDLGSLVSTVGYVVLEICLGSVFVGFGFVGVEGLIEPREA